ncbi:MAG: hypothetical protein H6718_08840 [Polyangiaceae bacterium]|nr:hypothetical protein [Myxococcales bacterium]MCB9585491.1 hypothetical protein [Polyangiaceae bacterium]MCB9606493.1 hypothetical protein [Polyangiaceae bacterium]
MLQSLEREDATGEGLRGTRGGTKTTGEQPVCSFGLGQAGLFGEGFFESEEPYSPEE